MPDRLTSARVKVMLTLACMTATTAARRARFLSLGQFCVGSALDRFSFRRRVILLIPLFVLKRRTTIKEAIDKEDRWRVCSYVVLG